MRADLEELLCRKYPNLFEAFTPHCGTTPYAMMYCEDGWFGLVDTAAGLLSKHRAETRIVGVKEKFGLLQLSLIKADDYARGIAQMAGILAGRICECCGNPGMIFQGQGRIACRCLDHAGAECISGKINEHKTKDYPDVGYGWCRLLTALDDYLDAQGRKLDFNGYERSDERLSILMNTYGFGATHRGAIEYVAAYSRLVDEATGELVGEVFF
jgi:hypothetical protein